MKHTKKMGKRMLAGILSTALLTSSAAFQLSPVTVKAADNDYLEALALSLYFYDANACGSDVDEGVLNWRGDCHVEDETALLSNATNFDSTYTSLVDPDGDGKVDVGGGYHDAGDHIKFNLTMGFGMSSLALSEYLNPGIYEKAGCKDHLIAICKRNADYLMKTTYLDASGNVATICHVVANGDKDHSMMTPPEEQHYDRETYWLTASKNNSAVCGEMASALAGCAYLVKDSDPSYAKTCIKYAKALVDFGKKHVGNEGGGLSSFYATDAMYQDEMALADAWLYVCGEGSKPTLTPNNGQYNGVYDYYRYTWDKVWQGYSALMYKATGDSVFAKELEFEINNAGGLTVGKYNGDGWGAARYNCGLQMSGLAVANGDKSNKYAEACKWQMDYILGDNPTGYSFLIGYGSKWPTHYHHRAANPGDLSKNPESKYCLYGALVGGIDASGNYMDHSDKYQYTEPALDYNGCFALACAGLANIYGGSDVAAKDIVSNASEIKYPYSFDGGTVVTPDPSDDTTEPSTDVTEPSTDVTEPSTDPTEPQPTQPNPNLTIKELEMSSDGIIDVTGIDKLVIKLNSTSSDTVANGGFDKYTNVGDEWPVGQDTWETSISNNQAVIEYDVPDGINQVKFMLWWPTTATVTTVEGTYTDTQVTTDPTEPVPTDSSEETVPTPDLMYGDVDVDGDVDIMDVILLNRNLMIGAEVSDQGILNADVDKSGEADAVDSLNILKAVVKLITLPIA